MQLRTTTTKDVVAPRLVCTFDNGDGYDGYDSPARHCDMAVLSAGGSPSYAFIPMPVRGWGPGAWDEVAPTVALQRSGPAGALKLRTKCRIYAEYNTGTNIYRVPVMNGWVVKHSHQGGEDSVITEVWDAKWILSKYTIKGRLCWDPSTNRVYWDLTSPKIYNALGYPDCLDHPQLGPVFAPCHRFGYKNDFDTTNAAAENALDDTTEPARGAATSRARSWTCFDALLDNRRTFSPSSGGVMPPFPVDIGNVFLPDDIVWPEGMGSIFGSDRTLKAFSLEGAGLGDGIQAILRKAGAYDLYIEPRGDGKSILTVLDMNPKSFTGCLLQTPEYAASNVGQAANAANIVKNWKVDESFINGFDEVVIAGDGPCREGMVSTYNTTAGAGADAPQGDSGPGLLFLEPAWSATDEFAFKQYVARYGNTQQAFESACKRWPLVYCAYRIRLGADIWAGTKWAGMQQGGYSRLEPFQLTGYQQDSANPRNWTPREIIVEYLDRYDDNYDPTNDAALNPPLPDPEDIWHEAARFDNLTLSADGTMVILGGLRQQTVGNGSYTYVCQQTHKPEDNTQASDLNSNAYAGSLMRKRHIRIQLAIKANFPLTGLAGRGGGKEDDPNRIYDRVEKKTRFTWLVCSPDGDYVEYLRHEDSRPIGEANCSEINDGGGRRAFPAKATLSNELFTDQTRILNHAVARLKDVKRVEISATLEIEQLVAAHRPGMSITLEGADTIPVFGVSKTVILRSKPKSDEEGQTTLIIEPPDSSAIYDAPGGSRTGAGYNSGYSDPTRKDKDEQYDDGGGKTQTTGSTGSGDGGYGMGGAIASANDDESNNQAIRNNPTAGGAGAGAAKPAASGAGRTANRAANAKSQAAAARAAGDTRAAEKHEKAARRLDRSAENQGQREATKRGDAFTTTAVNGKKVDVREAFGKSLEGGGFTMAGGTRQVRAGDLGRGGAEVTSSVNGKTVDLSNGGGLANTTKADAFDRKEYKRLGDERFARDSASLAKFAGTRQGGAAPIQKAPAFRGPPKPEGLKAPTPTVQQMLGRPQQRKPRPVEPDDE